MEYIGHKSDDGVNREQALIEHLNGTSALCSEFARRFTMEEIGKLLGLYHDVGKYSIGFQKRIQQNGPKVDHSTAGAQLLGKYFVPFAFCIAGHHSGLMNLGVKGDIDNGTLVARMRKKLVGILDYSAFKNELPELSVNKKLFPAFSDTFSAMFFTRMLFSCLVDADFLDTERFMRPNTLKRGDFSDLEELYKRYNAYIMDWGNPTNKLNKKRTEIREECINAAHGQEGIYTLTVPTGGGKTIASLGFALEHAMQHKNKERIIYVIPYTSIIEQTADVFRSIVGSENVVEHHMNVDYDDAEFGDEKQKENERKKLATENWDAPIIVTTNVQFFESLYGNKTSRCRKLHNIANSIVILDEAQMLPNDYLIPCMRAIRELVSNYHVTAVLCTATQPSLNKYFTEDVQLYEICSNVDDLYDFFRRVHYEKTDFEDTEALVAQLNIHKQVLCIVNSKKAAQKIFDGLNGDGCYHLLIGAVLRSILSGTKYPEALYQNTILRAKADQDNPDKNITKISRIKAAIMKACLIRNYKYNEEVVTVALNEECKKVPYVLGRLFAVLEDLQEKANPGINSTIKDRYFNSACANPSMTFPLLTKLANTHLKKISSQKGTVIYFEKLIGELMNKLEVDDNAMPARLSLPEQGEFVLGYYHQVQKRYEKKEEK